MYHQRLAAIAALGERAAEMDGATAQRTTGQLTQIVRSDPNPLIRKEAVRALGGFPGQLTGPALQAALQDEQTLVRTAACEALGRQGGPAALA